MNIKKEELPLREAKRKQPRCGGAGESLRHALSEKKDGLISLLCVYTIMHKGHGLLLYEKRLHNAVSLFYSYYAMPAYALSSSQRVAQWAMQAVPMGSTASLNSTLGLWAGASPRSSS